MAKKVFLSYVFEDNGYVAQIKDWAARGQLGDVEIVTESNDLRQHGDNAVYAHLRSVMRTADLALVLVGQDSHNRRWVDAEIRYFIGAGKPVLASRLPNTTGGMPPDLHGRALLPFNPDSLKAAIWPSQLAW